MTAQPRTEAKRKDRIVYSSERQNQLRMRGLAARAHAFGLTYVRTRQGEAWYLNAGKPTKHASMTLYRCPLCGFADSTLYNRRGCCTCCAIDLVARHALLVEFECGVDLGWRTLELYEMRRLIAQRDWEYMGVDATRKGAIDRASRRHRADRRAGYESDAQD
jgi:hypothetical protein